MITRFSPVKQFILPTTVALVSSLVGLAATTCLPGLDNALFEQLAAGFGGHDVIAAGYARPELWSNVLLVFLFTAAATLVAYKLGAKAGVVALLQLMVLVLLGQWLMWSWYGLRFCPLAMLLAMGAGFLGMQMLKKLMLHDYNSETQRYELMLRNLELKEAKLQMIRADEVERRLLAADLHDQVLNDLKNIKQKFAKYKNRHEDETAFYIENLLGQVMEEIHEVMDSLCPSVLEHLGLIAAVDECLRRACHAAGLKRYFVCRLEDDDLESLSTIQQAILYRLIQESITNACKHSGGNTLTVTMEKDGSNMVQIIDDGKGIDFSTWREDARGIRYMKQRADLIGAKIAWRNGSDSLNPARHGPANNGSGSSGAGTIVEIRLNGQK